MLKSYLLAEAGQPDWVIHAQLGHVSPAVMKTYGHVGRKALDAAAAVLEPVVVMDEEPLADTSEADRRDRVHHGEIRAFHVPVHVTPQMLQK